MLRTVLAGAAVGALAAPALAQPSDALTWTGTYVGVNLGAGVGDIGYPFSGASSSASANPVSGKFRQRASGGMAGGQIGYDYQTASGLVLGLVTDLDGSKYAGDSRFSSVDSAGNTYSGRLKTQIDGLGTVRGRLGMTSFNGRLLPYVTGGLAYGGVSTTASQVCSACGAGGTSTYASQYGNRTGWAAGVGADYALSPHLAMRTEYLYTDLGRQGLGTSGGSFSVPGVTVNDATASASASASILRVGLDYRF